jgi:fatty-acyl-CoA synthase
MKAPGVRQGIRVRTVGDITRLGARRYPHKTAVEMGDLRLTYAELNARANQLANALRDKGVQPGDRVAIMSENSLEFVVVTFATAKVGAVFVPLNFRYGPHELAYVLSEVCPAVTFAGTSYHEAVADAVDVGSIATEIVCFESGGASLGLDGLCAGWPTDEFAVVVDGGSVATILYTSGTTGHPKGVVNTHEATVRLMPVYAIEGDLETADRMLICGPLFHGGGLCMQLLPALTFGSSVVLLGKGFDPGTVLRLVADKGITVSLWAPTMFAMIANAELAERPDVSCLTKLWYGSSSIAPDVLRQARQQFRGAAFYQFYGTTEATTISILRPDDHDERASYTGRELYSVEVRIVDANEHDVTEGEIGEIIVADGGTCMAGYYRNEEATAATIRAGWLHTGDLARREADGYFTIAGRSSDLIITGGENVYPREVEEVLLGHDSVIDVSVYALPDPIYGECVAAAIVIDSPTVTVAELCDFAASRISRYKVPKIVVIVDELPRNASGKVVKRRLVEAHAAAEQVPSRVRTSS